jgi:hypothetical protein
VIHVVYLRLPADAKLLADKSADCVVIECPNTSIDELCKWLRLTADSLDGRLSASELGHLQDSVEPRVRAKAFIEAVEECALYSKSARTEEAKAVAMNIAVRITQRARK